MECGSGRVMKWKNSKVECGSGRVVKCGSGRVVRWSVVVEYGEMECGSGVW